MMLESADFTVRPFRPGDYDAVAAIRRAVDPSWGGDGTAMRRDNECLDPAYYRQRFIAEAEEQVTGYACTTQRWSTGDPQSFYLELSVEPDSRRKGVGSALYTAAREDLARLAPVSIRVRVGEFDEDAIRFVQKRGFVEHSSESVLVLDLGKFEVQDYEDRLNSPAKYGLSIKTYAELAQDAERDLKMYDLVMTASADAQAPEPFTPMPFDQYCKSELESDSFLPDACFVLTLGERYVGVSNLTRRADGDLDVGFTGIHRKARRRGLAFALKVRAVQYAIEQGHARIWTENVSTNRAILSINECLGFEKKPANLFMVWTAAATADTVAEKDGS
jgi:mycothiol synthase